MMQLDGNESAYTHPLLTAQLFANFHFRKWRGITWKGTVARGYRPRFTVQGSRWFQWRCLMILYHIQHKLGLKRAHRKSRLFENRAWNEFQLNSSNIRRWSSDSKVSNSFKIAVDWCVMLIRKRQASWARSGNFHSMKWRSETMKSVPKFEKLAIYEEPSSEGDRQTTRHAWKTNLHHWTALLSQSATLDKVLRSRKSSKQRIFWLFGDFGENIFSNVLIQLQLVRGASILQSDGNESENTHVLLTEQLRANSVSRKWGQITWKGTVAIGYRPRFPY